MANRAENKLDKTNVKYRKVEEGPIKKTGLEQLEQMKSKKREKNISISTLDETINKTVKAEKNKKISKDDRSTQKDSKKSSNKSNGDKRNSEVSIQDISESINNNLTVFKSRTKRDEDKKINISRVSNDISSNIEAKKRADEKNKDKKNNIKSANTKRTETKKVTSKNNSIDTKVVKSKNGEKNNKNSSSLNNTKQNIKQEGIEETSRFHYEDKKREITDISESSKVRKQAKRRSNKRKRQLKVEAFKQKLREINVKRVAIIASIALVIIVFSVAISLTMIQETIIDEGSNYTEKQIEEMVINNIFDHNSVYLFLKYRYSDQEKIPFVEYIDVAWENATTVKIKVYDKNIIACTNFMNEYIYFDKDGMVVESSNKKQDNIQYITGLNFKEVKLNDKIKVSDDKIFDTILSVTQQISKYDLKINEINFDKEKNITLHTDNITILMGKKDTYDEQLAKLKNMLEEADKKQLKGILHMENYVEGQNRIIFNKID